MGENVVKDKSRAFALEAVQIYQQLNEKQKEFILSRQFVRAATSIGANIVEAHHAMSKKEFVAKMNISLKEAAETEYWLDLLFESHYLEEAAYGIMRQECTEIQKLLTRIIKTSLARG